MKLLTILAITIFLYLQLNKLEDKYDNLYKYTKQEKYLKYADWCAVLYWLMYWLGLIASIIVVIVG